jgi:hypothetical protein
MTKNIIITLLFLCFTLVSKAQKCGTDQYFNEFKKSNPELEDKVKEVIRGFSKNSTENSKSHQTITIPIVFNVIHNGESIGTGRNLSDAKIQEQIDILNNDFASINGGANTNIRFCKAVKDVWGNDTNGINRYYSPQFYYETRINCHLFNPDSFSQAPFDTGTDWEIKSNREAEFPSTLYLNVWTADIKTCGQDTALGYSSFPFILGDPSIDNHIDGIVVDFEHFGNNPSTGSTGKTLVHEAGHWLGLFHTFQSTLCSIPENDCSLEGDMICDTTQILSADNQNSNYDSNQCKSDTCTGTNTDDIKNYMNYADDSCMTTFTSGQKDRIHDILSFYRPSIYAQATNLNGIIACGTNGNTNGGGNSQCNDGANIPHQIFDAPSISINGSLTNEFGSRIEVNDKWFIAIDSDTDLLHIYKKIGCQFALVQNISVPLSDGTDDYYVTDETNDLILNKDEIIVSSYGEDTVFIYHYNEVNDEWFLFQSIVNNHATSFVGTGVKIINDFLLILENNPTAKNVIRVYRKTNSGSYVNHQTIAGSDNFSSQSKSLSAKNLQKTNVMGPNGIYDPMEILITENYNDSTNNNRSKILLLVVNQNNQWRFRNGFSPATLQGNIHDIEVTDDYVYILTQTDESNSCGRSMLHNSYITIFSYRRRVNSLLPINDTSFSQQRLYSGVSCPQNRDINDPLKFEMLDDEYLILGSPRSTMGIYKNINYSSGQITIFETISSNSDYDPNALNSVATNLLCSEIDFAIHGNLLFTTLNNFSVRIHDFKDILEEINYSPAQIENSNFYNREVSTVPEDYLTFANNISLSVNSPVSMQNQEKYFIAKESIVLKPGTTVSNNSKVVFRIDNMLCNNIITSISRSSSFKKDLRRENKNTPIENKLSIIKLFPNPATSEIHLQANGIKISEYTIYDMSGKVMGSKNYLGEDQATISIDHLLQGVYFIKVAFENGSNEVLKFIKE